MLTKVSGNNIQVTATGLEPRTTKFVNEHFDQFGQIVEFRFRACFEQGVP